MAHLKLTGNEKLKNYIAIVLDRSGSMERIRTEVIGAFNQQVDKIKEESKELETSVSLITFSTTVDKPVFLNEDSSKLKHISINNYAPDGLTAMYDAVGYTINSLKNVPDANNENVSFLVIVISDGAENNSKDFRQSTIAEMIQEVEKTERWTFSYLGANQDLSKVSSDMHLKSGNVRAFAATSKGVEAARGITTDSLGKYYDSRKRGMKSVANFFDDKDEGKEASR